MGDIRLKRCIQSLESVQSPKPAKNEPLPKLKIRRSQHGWISELPFSGSELYEDHSRESCEQDAIDPCDDDEVESTISTAKVKFWVGQGIRPLIGRHLRIKIWLAESWHHLKNSTELIQSTPRIIFPRAEAQINENKTVDTVCRQSLFDGQSSSELITQGYFHQVILGRNLVEMRVQMF